VLFGVALAVQLVLLYWPRAVQPAGDLPWDKLVHAMIFGLVYAAGVNAGIRWWLWLAVSLLHAGVSEVVQDTLLPHRSGDPYDALADAVGVLLAAVAVAAVGARRRNAPVRSPDSADTVWHAK
jgi:VanZ family protein